MSVTFRKQYEWNTRQKQMGNTQDFPPTVFRYEHAAIQHCIFPMWSLMQCSSLFVSVKGFNLFSNTLSSWQIGDIKAKLRYYTGNHTCVTPFFFMQRIRSGIPYSQTWNMTILNPHRTNYHFYHIKLFWNMTIFLTSVDGKKIYG